MKKVESKPDRQPKIAIICLLLLHVIFNIIDTGHSSLTSIASTSTISIAFASEEKEPELYNTSYCR